MKKELFKKLSLRVLDASKDAIMDDVINYELDSIGDFDELVSRDIPYLQILWEHAVSIVHHEKHIDDKDINCINTLIRSVDYLSDAHPLYEGDENIFEVSKYAFDSAEQVDEYVNYIRKKQSLLIPNKKTNKRSRV